jgi:hypothetical protein
MILMDQGTRTPRVLDVTQSHQIGSPHHIVQINLREDLLDAHHGQQIGVSMIDQLPFDSSRQI